MQYFPRSFIFRCLLLWRIRSGWLQQQPSSRPRWVSCGLELANTMSSWSWNLPPDPFPVLATEYGFFVTSLVYLSVSAVSLVFILREVGARRQAETKLPDSLVFLERYPIPRITST